MPRAVILTALPVEYLAVRSHLSDLQQETHPKGTIYERGRFLAKNQTWDVGIVEIGAGNSGAALESERAIAYFEPDVILFVGVAGGIQNVSIGDVVAATKVYGYESGKAEQTFKPRPEIGLPDYRLEQRAKAESKSTDWLKRLKISESIPKVLVAPIAAGEKVIASTKSDVLKFLQINYGDAVAVEMEGFGFLEAARANKEVSALVIRGISDLLDNKTKADKKGYQEVAVLHASAFAFEILAKLELNSESQQIGVLQTKLNQLSSKEVKEVISDIASKDPLTNRRAAQLLENCPDLISEVIGISPVNRIQIEAVRTLLRKHPEQSAKKLMECLDMVDENWHIAQAATQYFDPIHAPFCEGKLISNLESGSWYNRIDLKRLSIKALGQCGSSGWGPRLRKMLISSQEEDVLDADKNNKFNSFVVDALAYLFVRSVNDDFHFQISYASENLRQEINRQYQYTNGIKQYLSVIYILRDYCDGRHADAFIRDWLSSEVSVVVTIAADVLSCCQIIRAVKPLINVIKTRQEPEIIRECSSALGHIGTSEALEYLLTAPENSDESHGLVFTLEKIDGIPLFRKIVTQILDTRGSIRHRHHILRAIGRRRDYELINFLYTALDGSEPLERGTSALALARLKVYVNKDNLWSFLEQSSNEIERILIALAILTLDPFSYPKLKIKLRQDLSKESYRYELAIKTDIIEVLTGTQDIEAIELANAWSPFYNLHSAGDLDKKLFTTKE